MRGVDEDMLFESELNFGIESKIEEPLRDGLRVPSQSVKGTRQGPLKILIKATW